MKKKPLFLILTVLTFSCSEQKMKSKAEIISDNYIQYVNPFIGTDAVGNPAIGTTSGGNTYPGAVRPFGMVSVNPHTDSVAPNGYFFGKKFMYGFGHVHMSGVGCQDLGNIVLMPGQGKVTPDMKDYRSDFEEEQASPGYYKVHLKKDNIVAEMSSTLRSGISKYTFQHASDSSNIIIDLTQGAIPKLASQPSLEGSIEAISETEVEGWNYSGDFCSGKSFHAVYFVARFSKPAVRHGVWKDKKIIVGKGVKGKDFGAYLSFKTAKGESILVKVGISYVSVGNARENLDAEQPGWNFEQVKKDSENEWQKELSKVQVEGGTQKQKTIFYTGLYHMLLHPNVFSDVNGEYPPMREFPSHKSGPVKKAEGYTRYTVFSLWDTYRNVHPFFSLVYPERQRDMTISLIEMYEESGRLPKWELAGGETNTMVGDPSIPVIADSYIKGIRDIDTAKAFRAMNSNARNLQATVRPGLNSYLRYKYIPQDDRGEWLWGTVSTTQEYAFADWTLAQYCKAIGREKEYKEYLERSMYYRNLYDPKSGFIRPRNKDGKWYEPFNPDNFQGGDFNFPGAGGPGYVEGNAWYYQFFVPHDIPGLIGLMGGEEKFTEALNRCFTSNKFSLWNEPDMAYPFLYDYVKGQAWRTQQEVRRQMEMNFDASPQGIPGNDDCGTLSGFYVMGAMGFYPACPGSNEYQLCTPLFDKITIQLSDKYYGGNKFVIETKNNSKENIYINSLELNNNKCGNQVLKHEDIIKGGKLSIDLSAAH
ncbi:MAG: GH92 family glycosyl hydrolase [Cytophagaceae bacterium]